MAAIQLHVTAQGTAERVIIDGADLTNSCRGYVLRAHVGELPTLELDLGVYDVGAVDGEAEIVVPDHTARALIALGWTAPDTTAPYVHALLDALLTGKPLNFGEHSPPTDVRTRLNAAVNSGQLGTVTTT